jgi:hypothetical protein
MGYHYSHIQFFLSRVCLMDAYQNLIVFLIIDRGATLPFLSINIIIDNTISDLGCFVRVVPQAIAQVKATDD